jgi:hypothetical protein
MPVALRIRSWRRAVAVCETLLAAAALSLPAAQSAAARPYEPPPTPPTPPAASPGPQPPSAQGEGVQESAGPAVPAPPATADPASLPQLLTRLQTLYRQAESATESYNKAKETADQQRVRAQSLDGRAPRSPPGATGSG